MENKKLESSLKNMILSLLFISLGMSAALAYVYTLTKEPIERSQKARVVQAIREVLPPFDNDPTINTTEIDGLIFYTAKNGDSLVGYACKTFTNKGFSGYFSIAVGFLPDGTISNTSVLEQKETPGLGDKMKTKWKDQFIGKNPANFKLAVKKDGGDVDAITASTITSRAFCDAIIKANNAFNTKLKNKPVEQSN